MMIQKKEVAGVVFVSLVFLLVLIAVFSSFNGFTGFVVGEQTRVVSVNSVFNESGVVGLNFSGVSSLKASGMFVGSVNSSARVYFEDLNGSLFTVFDSERFVLNESFVSFDNACVDTCDAVLSD